MPRAQRSKCSIQRPASRVQRPTLASTVQEFWYAQYPKGVLYPSWKTSFFEQWEREKLKDILLVMTLIKTHKKKMCAILYLIRIKATFTVTVYHFFFLRVWHFTLLIWFINILFFQRNFFLVTASVFSIRCTLFCIDTRFGWFFLGSIIWKTIWKTHINTKGVNGLRLLWIFKKVKTI